MTRQLPELRVLTVRQPWAWAIIHGGKNVENRSRNIAGDYRGPVAIHAGLRYDEDAVFWDSEPAPHAVDEDGSNREPRGAIIGIVDLVGVHHADDSMACMDLDHGITDDGTFLTCSGWGQGGLFHLQLANPRSLTTPISFRGGLGLRRLPEDVALTVWEAATKEEAGDCLTLGSEAVTE